MRTEKTDGTAPEVCDTVTHTATGLGGVSRFTDQETEVPEASVTHSRSHRANLCTWTDSPRELSFSVWVMGWPSTKCLAWNPHGPDQDLPLASLCPAPDVTEIELVIPQGWATHSECAHSVYDALESDTSGPSRFP